MALKFTPWGAKRNATARAKKTAASKRVLLAGILTVLLSVFNLHSTSDFPASLQTLCKVRHRCSVGKCRHGHNTPDRNGSTQIFAGCPNASYRRDAASWFHFTAFSLLLCDFLRFESGYHAIQMVKFGAKSPILTAEHLTATYNIGSGLQAFWDPISLLARL